MPEIGEALRSVTAKRAFAVGEANTLGEDFFVEDEFVEAAFVEAAFALDDEAAEAEAEAGVDADAGAPSPSPAKADGPDVNPKTANNMAATATLTSPPKCACSEQLSF